jgi:hypothetical protein
MELYFLEGLQRSIVIAILHKILVKVRVISDKTHLVVAQNNLSALKAATI